MANTKKKTLAQIEASWHSWVTYLFPDSVKSPFADFHIEAWNWAWNIRLGVRPDEDLAMIVFRGGGKSSTAELISTMVACLGKRLYGWYISGTQEQADNHVQNVATLMETEQIDKYYPDIGTRQVGKHGNVRGWRRNRLWTKAGFVYEAIGLDKASRGGKIGERRPDFMILDEIDDLLDTAAESRRKIQIITHTLLPAGSRDLAVFATQNIVNDHSFFKMLADPDNGDVMANRRIIGPIPAVVKLKTERVGRHDVIIEGTARWEGFDLKACQADINRWGLPAFLAECQHDTKAVMTGKVFEEWKETHHIITKTEFRKFFKERATDDDGNFRFPLEGQVGMGTDYGTTAKHPCATSWAWKPPETWPLKESIFMIGELIRPEYPAVKDFTPVTPKRVSQAVHKFESDYGISDRIKTRKFSHEQSAAMNTFLHDLDPPDKIAYSKWRPDSRAGIAQIQNYMMIDWSKPHPFRIYPDGHELSGQPVLGCPRLFFIVDDGQGELWWDEKSDELRVKEAKNSKGFIRARFEIPKFHHPETPDGKEKKLPEKLDDDFIDGWRGFFDVFAPKSSKRTKDERLEEKLPEALRMEQIRDIEDPEALLGMWEARQIELDKMKLQSMKKWSENHWNKRAAQRRIGGRR